MRKSLAALAFLAAAAPASADPVQFDGYADLRLVLPPKDDRSWLDGGLGKLRYGRNDSSFQFAGAVGEAAWMATPELLAVAVARVEPKQKTFFDLLESYVRYRPVSTTPWRWSVKAGAFFAPFSLENTETGWSPYWTITPSAINSWFGDELRTVGAEFTVEWRGEAGTLTMMGSGFGLNDPAGVLMADRGWALDDRPTGLFDHPREPDAELLRLGDTPPDRTPIFKEFDNRIGWYAGASWDDARQWHVELIRYDNMANASAHQDDYFAWHTKFWDAGFSDHIDEFTIIAQALTGSTKIAPSPFFSSTTDFDSAFLLLGWERNDWRVAGRADLFHTLTRNSFGGTPEASENGYALTAAVSWLPRDWLKLTGELISVTSRRGDRAVVGIDPQQTETQFQLSAKFFLD
ncbi:MAG TPA: hypothetical protein VLT91_05760 [Rhizomicrobium sp.]|nr:hypothetical protein [Rhizomicrobium sp.]